MLQQKEEGPAYGTAVQIGVAVSEVSGGRGCWGERQCFTEPGGNVAPRQRRTSGSSTGKAIRHL